MKFSLINKTMALMVLILGLTQLSFGQTSQQNGEAQNQTRTNAANKELHGEATQGPIDENVDGINDNTPEGSGDGIPNEIGGANSGQGHGDNRDGAGDGDPNEVNGADPFPGNGDQNKGGDKDPAQGSGNPPEGAGDGIPNNFNGDPQFSTYMDEDGDGINDNRADEDGDGIPNGQDPDFEAKNNGQGNLHRIRVRNGSNCPEEGAGLREGGKNPAQTASKKRPQGK